MLQAAFEAASADERPEPPFHRAGPTPQLRSGDMVRIAKWCIEQIGEQDAEAQRAFQAQDPERIERLLDAMEHRLSGAAMSGLSWFGAELVRTSVAQLTGAHPAGALAEGLTERLTTWLFGTSKGDETELVAQGCAAVTGPAALVMSAADRCKEFIVELDEKIIEAEYRWRALASGPTTEIEPEKILWRGRGGSGHCVHWLVRLDDRDYGLLSRSKNKEWIWNVGTRDDALANVPDHLFEDAALHALYYDDQKSG